MKRIIRGFFIVILLIFTPLFFSSEIAAVETDLALNNAHYIVGCKYITDGNPDSAIIYLLKAKAQFSQSSNQSAIINCLYKLAFIESSRGNLSKSMRYINLANSHIAKNKNIHPLWADIAYMQGNLMFMENEFDKSYRVFEQCLLKSKISAAPDSTIARIYNRKAIIEYYKGNYSSAIELFTKSSKFGSNAFGKYSLFVSDQVNNQGVINIMMARYDEALSNFQQSENIMKLGKISSPTALAGTYTNIGIIFKSKSDFTGALQFFNKALELYLSDAKNGNSQIANTYMNIASVYHRQGDFDKQLEFLQTSLYYSEKYLPVLLPKIYWLLATYYSEITDFRLAELYYKKSINKNKELFGDGPALASILNNYGEFNLYFTKNFDKGLTYFLKALPLYRKLYGEHHPSLAHCLRNIGDIYFNKNEYLTALHYYHHAIIAVCEAYSDTNFYNNPTLEQSLADDKFVEILKSKSKALQAIADKQNTVESKNFYQQIAFQNYMLALKAIDKIRMGYDNDESRVFLSENEYDTYESAVNSALWLYENTHERKFFKLAFSIADKSHSASLQSVIREKELVDKLPKSDSTLIKEFSIRKELALYNEFITKEKTSQNTDSAKLKIWTQAVTDLSLKYEFLKAEIKIKKPAYYQFRYQVNNNELVNDLTRSISKNEVIIEYFYMANSLITFCLTSDTAIYKSQKIPTNFEQNIERVLAFVREPKIYQSDSSYYQHYRIAGWQLYQFLLMPFENIIRGKELTIIPDNKLIYLPFETLLTSPITSLTNNYKTLPYLIKKNSVRYLYAASLLNVSRNKPAQGGMAAFVPVYSANANYNNYNQAVSKTHGTLPNLQQTESEVKAIDSYFFGKIFSKDDASEENFKKLAHKYSTILLAMHAVIDDNNPLYSRLVFTSNSSKTDDDQLFTYETYNLNLNADLLVLSACNTGVGKLRKGEGLMSLTRGFSFAGVQSIVMTLWAVNDNSSADLMKRFYEKLSNKWNKSKALLEAKTEYIQNTDIIHAHPYYWAGYVLIGDNAPLPNSKTSPFYWLVLIPIGVGLWFGIKFIGARKKC